MTKNRDKRQATKRKETVRAEASAIAASRRLRRLSRNRDVDSNGTTRREFISFVGAAGASLGMSALASDGAFAESSPGPADDLRGKDAAAPAIGTLFFNLSHVDGPTSTHTLWFAGRKYVLGRTRDNPQMLADARRDNGFLQLVPDAQITHYVVGLGSPGDIVKLAYLATNEDASSGTWDMTGMFTPPLILAFQFAYQQARMRKPRGLLPLSMKRRAYNVPAARTLRDLQEEQVLIDPTNFAATMVSVHPDIMAVQPSAWAHIQANYISQDSTTETLARTLRQMGPAIPDGSPGTPGLTPWATMTLVTDADGKPLKKSDGLNTYYPNWNPQVSSLMAGALVDVHPLVKNDTVLGTDVTGFNLNDPNNPPPPANVNGKLWARRDGIATIDQATVIADASGAKVVFTNQSADTGLVVGDPTFGTLGDGRVQVTFNNVSNWFLRWLGVWIQFIDQNQVVIPLNEVENDTYPAEPGPYPRAQDRPDAMFLGAVSPAFTIAGIPIQPGTFSPTIKMPAKAASMRIYYTGIGLAGSMPVGQDSFQFYQAGFLLTAAFNWATVGFFMAVGTADDFAKTTKLIVGIGGGAVAAALSSLTAGITNETGFIKALGSFTANFLKVLLQTGISKVLTEITTAVIGDLAEAAVLDSIPIAGAISEAVAAIIGGIQLAETTLEIAISPPAYVFDLVATHNLSVTFMPSGGAYAPVGGGNVLYRKVSYLFDNGTAHALDNVIVDTSSNMIPITFNDIPFGGQVNIAIGLYVRNAATPPGQNDFCAGFGKTGLVSNTVDRIVPPSGGADYIIEQVQRPIDGQTVYIHSAKTALDAKGNHLWQMDTNGTHAPPYIPPPNSQGPSLGGFDGITVRQNTGTQAGYVGYAWQAYSRGVSSCVAHAPGQFDQMANLNIDMSDGGVHAQDGYTNSQNSSSNGLCGFNKGVAIAYNLLTANARNMYLDTVTNTIRPVTLDPPTFYGPTSNKAFAKLNLTSTRCLLHPAGHIVSINRDFSKIETVRLMSTPQSDADAALYSTARTFSGPGLRAGLMDSPTAAAISPDGAIVVLEDMNNRMQAFDLGGNALPYFKNQPDVYFFELTETANNLYLDLAVEFSGYLYVISQQPNLVHRLDIYHPSQKGTAPISTTMNLNAAKITVDFWRQLYSLNYEVLLLPNGTIPDFTEPSVSAWLPSLPGGNKSWRVR
jgi:hypothetical protein